MKSSEAWTAALLEGRGPASRTDGRATRLKLGAAGGFGAVALASALIVGSPLPALSDAPGPPQNSHVWAGCTLSPDTVANLQADVNAGIDAEANTDIQVAFVVVYALTKDNDGQSLGEASTTGPILCTNPSEVGIENTTQTTPIPPTSTGATSVNTLDAEDAFILRYDLNGGANSGTTEKVICHTVNDQVDCFRISPLLAPDE